MSQHGDHAKDSCNTQVRHDHYRDSGEAETVLEDTHLGRYHLDQSLRELLRDLMLEEQWGHENDSKLFSLSLSKDRGCGPNVCVPSVFTWRQSSQQEMVVGGRAF